jgi:hypothetical protein
MLVFLPVRVGMLETLNWPAKFSPNMRKHAGLMFLYDLYWFCAFVNMACKWWINCNVAGVLWGLNWSRLKKGVHHRGQYKSQPTLDRALKADELLERSLYVLSHCSFLDKVRAR